MVEGNGNFQNAALVTGASEGIGKAFTHVFARDGYDLVMVARNENKMNGIGKELSQKYGVSVRVIRKDLSDPNAAEEIYEEVTGAGINVKVLINNAGFGVQAKFNETDISTVADMINVLMTAPTKLTHYFMNDMLKAGEGRIMNLSSLEAVSPTPLNALYAAAKTYILNLTEALIEETHGTSVKVMAVCPGAVRTEFFKRAGMNGIVGALILPKTPDSVAQEAYEDLMGKKRRCIPGIHTKTMILLGRHLPITIQAKVARIMTYKLSK